MKNKKIKISVIILLMILFLIIICISIPNIGLADLLERDKSQERLTEVGKISQSTTPETNQIIREHRGYTIKVNNRADPPVSYENAAGKTGIKDNQIATVIKEISDDYNWTDGWYNTLWRNTSVFCQQAGQPLPSYSNRYLSMFHNELFDTNEVQVGFEKEDYIENYLSRGCKDNALQLLEDDGNESVEPVYKTVYESDVDRNATYTQHTRTRVEYSYTPRTFDVSLGYIMSYSIREWYKDDYAQIATWLDINKGWKSNIITEDVKLGGTRLYRAASAVEELSNPTKPVLSVTSDSTKIRKTGTVIEGNNYKIGPIAINNYTYGWSNDAGGWWDKPDNAGAFSGNLICGIEKAVMVLDNGIEIPLSLGNFSYSEQAQGPLNSKGTDFTNPVTGTTAPYWESPSKHGYQYPTPNSKFYITVPIASCGNATKVSEIKFTYKYTTAEGSGYDLKGTFIDVEWEGHIDDLGSSSCTYDCPMCENDGLSYANRTANGTSATNNEHAYWCGGSGHCEVCGSTSGGHTHCSHGTVCSGYEVDNGCDCDLEKGESCSTDHGTHTEYCGTVSYSYCEHGYYLGHHENSQQSWGGSSAEALRKVCYGSTDYTQNGPGEGATCIHHHSTCRGFTWKVKSLTTIDAQKLIAVNYAQVKEFRFDAIIKDIPLIANVEINKYVYDVEHVKGKNITNYDSTMRPGDFRSQKTEAEKQSNPVYVEFGDYVTFKIEIANNSAFGVKVIASDILPPDSRFDKAVFSVNGGAEVLLTLKDLEQKIIQINPHSKASFTITIQVESLEGKYTNTGKLLTRNHPNDPDFKDYVRTIDDDGPIVVVDASGKEQTKWTSQDSYILNDYDLSIDKYVSSYDATVMDENNSLGFTDNETSTIGKKFFNNPGGSRENYEDDLRYGLTDGYKDEHPFEVEKTEKIVYSIRLTNNDLEINPGDIPNGGKQGTQVRPTRIRENLDNGLKYEIDQGNVRATIFGSDGKVKKDNIYVTETDLGNNCYEFYIGNETILDPGDIMIFFVTVEIEKSNMFLTNLENSANFTVLTNINDNTEDREIYRKPDLNTVEIDRNIHPQEVTKEYVKQKDLIIAGKVFIDEDEDGVMNPETPENRLDKVVVSLYRVDGANGVKVGETQTKDNNGEHGFYTFERVDKADNKQVPSDNNQTGNGYYIPGGYYTENSNLYEYYVEFEYDGTTYKATEVYGGRNEEQNPNYGDNNITDKWLPENDGKDSNSYITDSNAYEFTDVRKEYDKQFETIGYNKAYYAGKDVNSATDDEIAHLTYTKEGHESKLDVMATPIRENDPKRAMRARSFIKKEVIEKENGGYFDKGVNESLDNTKTLWLYQITNDQTLPETEYLKYINLGLVEREDVNVSLTKDLYSITTTINGEQVTYDYAQNGIRNNEIYVNGDKYYTQEEAETEGITSEAFNETNGKYIDNKNYKLNLYDTDYNYRFERYEHQAVRDYKTKFSELNIEVTFKIKITNESIQKDDVKLDDQNKEVIVTIDEVSDYYDKNFVEYTQEIEDAYKDKLETNSSTNYEDIDGYPMMTEADLDSLDESKVVSIRLKKDEPTAEDPTATTLETKHLEVAKAWYYDKDGELKGLKLTNTSNYNPEVKTDKASQYDADGYRKLYIRGFNNVKLAEGESVDIYVKYIVDKETSDSTRNILNMTTWEDKDASGNYIHKNADGSYKEADIIDSRNLKITETIANEFKEKFGRYEESISEISAYSVWYPKFDTSGDKAIRLEGEVEPAGLVDRNSNPDNIGVSNTADNKTVSIDDVTLYEDDTYKTGIEFKIKAQPIQIPDPDPEPDPDPDPDPNPPTENTPLRKISGRFWDDTRSEPVGDTSLDTQYSGNGIYDTTDEKKPLAKMNDNITKNYGKTEENDITVRNARAELVEIVQIGDRYYEEQLYIQNVNQTLITRTDENGNYSLFGFIPGYYVVRFGYGDYVEGKPEVINDMALFNGQDYKSTKYTSVSDDETDQDKVIEILEAENLNDARDDEIDRLNNIAFSEVMINQIAEILKGSYEDGATDTNIRQLLENTSMNAETVKFLVKPEKLTTSQIGGNLAYSYRKFSNLANNLIDSRDFKISNVDFGIEYRPESQVNLVKEIDTISLITSDGNELLRLKIDTELKENANGEVTRVHTVNQAESVGLDKAQFLSNEYTFTEMTNGIFNSILDETGNQGFIYINVDDDILQGSTVTIRYKFGIENNSEIDRIGTKLNALRFKQNPEAIAAYRNTDSFALAKPIENVVNVNVRRNNRIGFIQKALISDKLYKVNNSNEILGTNAIKPENTDLYDTKYTGSGTASNILVKELYKVDEHGDIYRKATKIKYNKDTEEGYYGKFLGDYYYTAQATDNDVVAQIKFDKILDYVDNDLVFKAAENNTDNEYWGTTTAKELKDNGYINPSIFVQNGDKYELHDKQGISYDSVTGENDNITVNRTNLAVSVSDRIRDDVDEGIKNLSISRFLVPIVSSGGRSDEILLDENDMLPYAGKIYLTLSKLISQETLADDMTYENIAEIIQFTITNGRRTNFMTTIGNASLINGEWKESIKETDTSTAERITFTPPTGLNRTELIIKDVVEKTSGGLAITGIVIAVAVVVIVIGRFIIVKIKKRPIK